MPGVLSCWHWVAKQDMPKSQQTHAIQVEVYLQTSMVVEWRVLIFFMVAC